MKKKRIIRVIEDYGNDETHSCIYLTPESLISMAEKLKEEASKFENSSKLRLEQIWDGYEECHFELCFESNETDEEYKNRIEKENNEKEKLLNEQKKKEEQELAMQEYNALIEQANEIKKRLEEK